MRKGSKLLVKVKCLERSCRLESGNNNLKCISKLVQVKSYMDFVILDSFLCINLVHKFFFFSFYGGIINLKPPYQPDSCYLSSKSIY